MLTIAPIPLSQVVCAPVERLSTGCPFLDWCFGSTAFSNRQVVWGLPAGGLTLIHGASGCGKSRLAIAVAAAMTRACLPILYSQGEVALPQFKLWVTGQRPVEGNFLVSACEDVETLTAMMYDIRPALVVVDSISMLAGIERQSRVREVVRALKRAVEATGAHGLLLAHENARGQVRGGTLLPHMVDVVARVYRIGFADWARFEIAKNRFGSAARSATFNHEANGLRPIFISDEMRPMFEPSL